eukprot:7034943-Prymnesium_polylepis.1
MRPGTTSAGDERKASTGPPSWSVAYRGAAMACAQPPYMKAAKRGASAARARSRAQRQAVAPRSHTSPHRPAVWPPHLPPPYFSRQT